jgi:DNA-binding transcriptional ArsR family regulator
MAFSVAAVEGLFKVLGDENRLRILLVLSSGECSVSQILESAKLPQTLTSFHLRVLREAGVLMTERRGPFIYYRLADPTLPNLLEACGKYAETLTEGKRGGDFQWPPWGTMCRMVSRRRR